jgi:aminomethyltransferase
MVEFAGYEMPVQFRGIIPEHERVRTTVGVFDVSHMGRIEVRGADAERWLNRMTTNDVSALAENQAQYSVLCYPDGGIVDDLVVYRLSDHYLLVVNGANNDKDTAWLKQHVGGAIEMENVTGKMTQLAVQGPLAEKVMQPLCDVDLSEIEFYWSRPSKIGDAAGLVSRTGYTGEDGFELYFPAERATDVWDAIFDSGAGDDIEPIGLGARDTLRMEMKYALYGNDIDRTTNPLEAGLGFVVKLGKPEGFVGSDVLARVKADKPERRLVCLQMQGRGIPRPGQDVYADGDVVGKVTSGTMSPSLKQGIALAYVRRGRTKSGTRLEVDVRGSKVACEVVKPPFYKHGSRK